MEDNCKNLEKKLLENPHNHKKITKELKMLKYKQNLIDTEELAQQMKLTKQNFFKKANKPGKWLAYKLKEEKEKKQINKLRDDAGIIQTKT